MKVGDRVICIKDDWQKAFRNEVLPQKDKVYTIRELTLYDGVAGVRLEEIRNEVKQYTNHSGECAFNRVGFVPIKDNFKPIKFKKVVEKEQPITSIN